MYHVSASLSRGTVTLPFPPYLTVAHLVLQNYVADYINVPCFGKSVKGNGNSYVPSLSYCRPSRPSKLCSRLHKCTMFRKVCQMEMFRAGEIHELSSRSEISSCFDVRYLLYWTSI